MRSCQPLCVCMRESEGVFILRIPHPILTLSLSHPLFLTPFSLISSSLPTQVDLGGGVGEGSRLLPFSLALGMRDAFVERILMSVNLVRDEVEHNRFVLEWRTMLGGCAPEEEAKM